MWQEQEIIQLYESIFYRKSVRNFVPEPLEQQFLNQLLNLCAELTPALRDAPVAFRLLTPAQIKGSMAGKAQHFLALYAGAGEEAIINAAFMMQQVNLWLSAQGVGVCWMGIPQPVAEVKSADGLNFVVMLVFGQPKEEPHREDLEEFKRKELAEITDTRGMEDLLTPLRLAPSAINRQPWYVTAEKNCLHLHLKRQNIIMKAALKNMPLVDIGIGLCHLWLATQAAGRFDSLIREGGSIISPPGHRYAWTVKLTES